MYFDYDILHFQNYARSGPGSSTNADGQDYGQVVGEDFIHRRQQAPDGLIGALARDGLLPNRYREETSVLIAGQRYTVRWTAEVTHWTRNNPTGEVIWLIPRRMGG
ncbi:hypothetical protein [Bradyrhizobium neotropicale]|uniref:hypothetical protein n=1 Tax=Bradyrhizobium neotropicale TaxID=1497615 RepID=UPI0007C554DD|nr:hypothetical protein [Bradyrhizobium neotropicale]